MASRALLALVPFGGVAARGALVGVTSDAAVDWGAATGQVLRILPRTFVHPSSSGEWVARARAATAYAGAGAAISHLSALRVWGLPVPPDAGGGSERGAIDVLVPHDRRPRAVPSGGQVHVRRSRHQAAVRRRSALDVVTLERAVVESWPLLVGDAQRAPAIVAVRRRLTTPSRLRRQLADHPRLRGRRALHELLDLLELGCHSELEVWGHHEVFVGPRFDDLGRQVPVDVRGRRAYLDLYDERAMLAIELDGREYHDDPRDRERDIVRDAALAETGRLTLRFSHRRLTNDPVGCREQAWRVMQVRRSQLGAPVTDADALSG